MTLDISSESSNIKPTKQPRAPDNAASSNPEASFENLKPTASRWGYAQAASRTQRSIQNIRALRSSQTPGAEATSSAPPSIQNPQLSKEATAAEANANTNENGIERRSVSTLRLPASAPEAVPVANGSIKSAEVQPNSSQIADEADADSSKSTRAPELIASLDVSRDPQLGPLGNEEKIQILDIHTINPLISFQKQLYSCSWTSTIGTDLLLTASPISPKAVLKKTPSYNILAASGIKLIGRPVRLISKEEERFNNQRMKAALSSSLSVSEKRREEVVNEMKPVTIPVDAGSSIGRQNQARFLERLIAIKAAKGEKDSVTVYAQKTLTGTGWRAKQRADRESIQSDEHVNSQDKGGPPAAQVAVGRPPVTRARKETGRGSRKSRAKGGLFRERRPNLADEVGLEIRDGDSVTARGRRESPRNSENINGPDQDPISRGIASPAGPTIAANEGRRSVDVDMADASS